MTADSSEWVRRFLASGQTQAQFCATHAADGGPAPRTLRTWLAQVAKPADFRDEARAIVVTAMAQLQALLAGFDAAASALSATVDGVREDTTEDAEGEESRSTSAAAVGHMAELAPQKAAAAGSLQADGNTGGHLPGSQAGAAQDGTGRPPPRKMRGLFAGGFDDLGACAAAAPRDREEQHRDLAVQQVLAPASPNSPMPATELPMLPMPMPNPSRTYWG